MELLLRPVPDFASKYPRRRCPYQHVEPPLIFSSLAFDRSYYSGNPIVQPLRIHLELP